MRESKKVDGSVKETGAELGLKVNRPRDTAYKGLTEYQARNNPYSRLEVMREVGNVNQSHNVQGELQQDRQKDVEIENVAKRPLF